MSHGPACICEICTCGRHQCPHDRNTSSLRGLGHNTDESPFYRKEFATVSPSSEKTVPIRPRRQLSFGDFKDGSTDLSIRLRTPNGTEQLIDREARAADVKNRFITSAALKKRGEGSQIEMNRANGEAPLSTYQAQTRGASGLAERAKATRPGTSEFWKKDGIFDGTTISGSEYTEKRGDRYNIVKRTERGILPAENDRSFQRETSNLSDYGPKKGERYELSRPADSRLFSNEDPLDSTTVHRSEYQAKKGDRYAKKTPVNASGELLRGDGSFLSETSQNAEYRAGKGDRYETKRRGSSDIWKTDGKVSSSTVNRDDYAGTRGEQRYPTVRPKDSGILRGEGNFVTLRSSMREDYQGKKADPVQQRRPPTSDLWKTSGGMDKTSVNRSEYSNTRSERYDVKRPTDSNLLKSDDRMQGQSHSSSEFGVKKGDRFESKKHGSSDIWKQNGPVESSTVSSREYAGKKGERFETKRPTDTVLFDPDIDAEISTTVHHREFGPKKGERYEAQRRSPSDLWNREGTLDSVTTHADAYGQKLADRVAARRPADSDILKGSGAFDSETVNSREYQAKRGERFDPKRQEPSDLWKREGEMEKTTVNRDGYYSNMKGERFDVRRPVDSDLLRGDGTFMSETHTGAEFGAKKGERAKQTLHGPSDIWDNDGNQKFESSTVNRSDYGGGGRGERFERRVPVDSDNILSREGTMFEGESITTHEFKPKKGERMDVKRPETSEIWKREGTMDVKTVSQDEYTGKKGETSEIHIPVDSMSLYQQQQDGGTFMSRTMTQDDFGPKVGEREKPVVHASELSLTEPNASFDSHTVYGDNFQNVPAGERFQAHRPTTALKLEGTRDFTSGYKAEYQNKVVPCPAGELMESVNKDHTETEHFKFHQLNKGHHFYKSKENLTVDE